jgi:predicted acylesterase/phospholipase RssA
LVRRASAKASSGPRVGLVELWRHVTTAFVLSGGASLGAVQVGMYQALDEAGVAADMVFGASVGAVNGAWIADK